MMCLDITCRKCDSDTLTRVTGTAASTDQLKIVLRCDVCGHEFGMAIVLFPVPIDAEDDRPMAGFVNGKSPSCGTEYGYKKHYRDGTTRCPECIAAHSAQCRKTADRRKALAAA